MDDADRASELEESRLQMKLNQIQSSLKPKIKGVINGECSHCEKAKLEGLKGCDDCLDGICCIDCGDEIDEERRMVLPNCTRCVTCQELEERKTRVRRF